MGQATETIMGRKKKRKKQKKIQGMYQARPQTKKERGNRQHSVAGGGSRNFGAMASPM